MSETCRACSGPVAPDGLSPDDDLPLCRRHWNWWLMRFAVGEWTPPCNAHLIVDHPPAPAAGHVAAADPNLPEPSRRSPLFSLATATGAAAVLIAVAGIYVLTGTM